MSNNVTYVCLKINFRQSQKYKQLQESNYVYMYMYVILYVYHLIFTSPSILTREKFTVA